MPITVTTTDDEDFNGGTQAGETSDGNGLSLREAFDLLNAGTSTGPISFAAPGTTFFTNSGPLIVNVDITIDGDTNDDGIADISIINSVGTPVISIATDGVTFHNNGASIVADGTGTGNTFNRAAEVLSDNVTFINSGDIFSDSEDGMFGERGTVVQILGDGFTFINEVGSTLITTNRYVLEVLLMDGMGVDTTIVNHGYMESSDDPIRIASGVVTNSGSIITTGTFNFNGAGNFEPGEIADCINIVALYDADFVPNSEGLLVVNNLDGGLFSGFRTALFLGGGATVNNDGTIVAEVMPIYSDLLRSETVSFDSNFIVNNSSTGIIERTGGEYGFLQATVFAAISTGELDSSLVVNSGQILSVDNAISAFNSMTLINQVGGVIQGDTDATGNDAISFRGSLFADFAVSASISSTSGFSGRSFVSAQNVSVTSDNELMTDVGTFPFSSGSFLAARLFRVDAPDILPLVDLAATQANGVVTFQSNANGELYPSSIDVITAEHGTLTVSFVSGSGFTITDSSGSQAFALPVGVDFADDITNSGTMIGDVITGLGDDNVTTTSIIDGDVLLGMGNDDYRALGNALTTGRVLGGEGDDSLRGSNNIDQLFGGVGNDSLFGGNNNDTLVGGDGDDALFGGSGLDTLTGGDGNDDMNGGLSDDIITGNDGNDMIAGGRGADTINGGSGNDTVFGGIGADIITGANGNDILNAGQQSDTVYGGAGDDIVNGNNGNDFLDGGAGVDTIDGGAGNDIISGGGSADTLLGNIGNDTINGGAGDDIIDGGAFQDLLLGNAGNDTINGGTGLDTLIGGGGQDTLFGDAGNDNLSGDAGGDDLFGGDGDDVLNGGGGNDILNGGAGADVFVANLGFRTDRVQDFENGIDMIDFSGNSLANNFAAVLSATTQVGANVRIDLNANNALILENFNLADLDASDFIF